MYIHSDKKIPDRSQFFEENFDGFWSFSQKVSKIQKSYIPMESPNIQLFGLKT